MLGAPSPSSPQLCTALAVYSRRSFMLGDPPPPYH